MLLIYTLALLVCFVLLARIVDLFFITSLDKIAHNIHLSSDAAGATLMAVGSSAPELFVALFAVFKRGNHQAIAIGSIVGSAIFNLLVIIGATALARKTKLTWQPAVRDLFFYTIAVALLVLFIWDGSFTLTEAIILMVIYFLYIVAVVYWKKIFSYTDNIYKERAEPEFNNKGIIGILDSILFRIFPDKKNYYIVFLISVVIIASISWALVELAVVISHILNIPEAIIALTVLAVGTSVPDLFSSVIVAREGRGDMAVSNAIGSNIFDILIGLGLPLFLFISISGNPVSSNGEITSSTLILFGSVILLLLWLVFNKWKIGKITGFVLVGIYLFYVVHEILLL